jgi:pimeloyl-ACP methyl ester carboxylesterase
VTLPPPNVRRLALTNGLTYNVLEWGAGNPVTIVLVHGFLDLAWGWDEVPARLAQTFHVVAPDLRGHGDTDWIGAGGYYHFFDYVADLDEVVNRVRPGKDRVAVVGHSMGGGIASYWAGTRPERVRAMVSLEGIGPPEASTPIPERTARWIEAWRVARAAGTVMASSDDAAARLRKHDHLLDPARAQALAARGTRPVPGGGGAVTWKHDPLHLTQGPHPYRVDVAEQFWRRIEGPVLYVEGAESRFRLADTDTARRLAAFKEVRREVIAGAGHMMQRHQPAAVAALIDAHVSATGA